MEVGGKRRLIGRVSSAVHVLSFSPLFCARISKHCQCHVVLGWCVWVCVSKNGSLFALAVAWRCVTNSQGKNTSSEGHAILPDNERERKKQKQREDGEGRRKEACDDTSKSSFPPSLLRKQGCSLEEEEEWWRKHSCHNCNERKEERKVGLSPKGIYPEGGAFSFLFPPLPILPSISSCCCIPPPTSCVRSTVLLFHYFFRSPFLRGKVSCFSPFPLFFSKYNGALSGRKTAAVLTGSLQSSAGGVGSGLAWFLNLFFVVIKKSEICQPSKCSFFGENIQVFSL